MKLYIPSCTLNFNNIFTTESISPKSFYSKRGFGNKRYYGVEANDLDDVILLYSKYPVFQVNDDDIENYPIVIEIETDDYSDKKFNQVNNKDGVDVYACSDTVYLNPFHCHVYFNSYAERQGTLTKAEQSLENKFSILYSSCFMIKQTKPKSMIEGITNFFSTHENGTEFKWDSSYKPSKTLSGSVNKIEEDTINDRIKGFLYCYLIGANTSVSQEIAELQTIARNLRNTLSAAFNSPDHRPTNAQDASLLESIKNFNAIFEKTDEAAISNHKKIENKLKLSCNPLNLSVDQGIEFLKSLNVYSDFCAKLKLIPTFDANDLWTCFEDKSPETFNRVVERLKIAVKRIIAKERSNTKKKNISEIAEIGCNKTVLIKDVPKKDFYEKLVQSQIKSEYKKIIDENAVEAPLAIAYNGGRILKEIMGNKWESTPSVSVYIANLLNHFQESAPFNLLAFNNEVICSFAAFCQKGDNIDRLLDYLEQCGIRNPKFALGLHGATYGFASLPKTFTSQLINGDKEYYKKIYLTIHKNLFGKTLENALFPQPESCSNNATTPSSIGSKPINKIDEIGPKQPKQSDFVNTATETERLNDAVLSPKEFMCIAQTSIVRTGAYKALKSRNFEKDSNKYTSEELLNQIMDIISPRLPQNKKTRQETLDKIRQIIAENVKKQNSEASLSNSSEPSVGTYKKTWESTDKQYLKSISSGTLQSQHNMAVPRTSNAQIGSILLNKDWIVESSRLINDEKNKQQYIKDAHWFIDNHFKQSKEGQPGYSEKSKDNVSVFNRLEKYLKRKQEPNEKAPSIANIYKNIPIGDILAFIQKKFDVKQDYDQKRQW